MKNELNEKQFFIIEKNKYYHKTTYRLYDETMYDLTNAVRKILALDTLNEDRKMTSYHLQEVSFSEIADKQKPLVLTDEVKEDNQEELPF
jgi:muramoyltetrapeptide carboxypeptidase LdcA involved in peptidoglycan recycling